MTSRFQAEAAFEGQRENPPPVQAAQRSRTPYRHLDSVLPRLVKVLTSRHTPHPPTVCVCVHH